MEFNNILLNKMASAEAFEHPAIYGMKCKNLTNQYKAELAIHKFIEDENITNSFEAITSMLCSIGMTDEDIVDLFLNKTNVTRLENNVLEIVLSATYSDGTTISVSKKCDGTNMVRSTVMTFLTSLQYSKTLIDNFILNGGFDHE